MSEESTGWNYSDIQVLVVGTGAIGGYFGGKLAQTGAQVSTLCRSDYEVVKERGIEVTSKDGNFHFQPSQVIRKIDQYKGVPDFIIISTKVLPEIDLPKLIMPAVGKNTCIVLIQNGVEIEQPIAQAFPNNEIISGLAFICVHRTEPGKIHHQDYGRLVMGNFPQGISPRARVLGDMFKSVDVSCRMRLDILRARWEKLVWNAPFNPISVLAHGVNTEQIIESKESYKLVKNVMEEILLIAKSTGNEIKEDFIESNLNLTKNMIPYKTSMLNDFENGLPLEVEAILGNTVKIARKLQLHIPNLESLYSLLTLLESNRSKRWKYLPKNKY